MGTVQGWCSIGHHPEDGEIVAGLVTFSATLVLVVDDVFTDVTVNVFVTEIF
jgi:hypothetical protein